MNRIVSLVIVFILLFSLSAMASAWTPNDFVQATNGESSSDSKNTTPDKTESEEQNDVKTIVCENCGGDGKVNQEYCQKCSGRGTTGKTVDCSNCGGVGKVYSAQQEALLTIQSDVGAPTELCWKCLGRGTMKELCSYCNGRGEFYSTCPVCGGSGSVNVTTQHLCL